jgi:hypothetical protein
MHTRNQTGQTQPMIAMEMANKDMVDFKKWNLFSKQG